MRPPLRTASALLALLVTACFDHPAAAPVASTARVMLDVTVPAAGEHVDVDIAYARAQSADVILVRRSFPIDSAGAQDLRIDVDITPCLADAQRLPTSIAGACPIMATIVLRDAASAALDSTRIGPVEISAGSTVESPNISLQAAANLQIVSGDGQAVWSGAALLDPVVVRLIDRAGAPIADRTLSVATILGAGASLPSSVLQTNASGEATLHLRLGPQLGAQRFRVALASPGDVAPVEIAATAILGIGRDVGAGAGFSCGTRASTAYCWGDNSLGALGSAPVTADTVYPIPAGNALSAATLSVTGDNVATQAGCLVTPALEARCWGVNENNELGVSTTATCTASQVSSACARSPLPVSGGFAFRQVSVGGGGPRARSVRACAVTTSALAYCWGDNSEGGVGDGTTIRRTAPTPVIGTKRWLQLDVGERASCGIDDALSVWCWGSNDGGMLGSAIAGNALSPVLAPLPQTTDFMQVEVGSGWACALAVDGVLVCWGRDWSAGGAIGPARTVGGALRFSSIAVGTTMACGIASDASVHCFGLGFLGNGGISQRSSGPVQVRLTAPAVQVSVGDAHACIRSAIGEIHCWGRGASGAIGAGTRGDYLSPALVVFDPTSSTAPPVLLAAGPTQLGRITSGATLRSPEAAVRVVSGNGNGVAGVEIQWSASGGGTVAVGASSLTDSAGVARAGAWRSSTTLGVNTLVATARTLAGTPTVGFTVEGIAPSLPSRLVASACFEPTPCTYPVATDVIAASGGISVTAVDSLGLPVPGARVDVRRNTRGSVIVPSLPTTMTTDANGVARLTQWALDSVAGTDTVTFTLVGISASPREAIVTGAALAPARIVLVQQPNPFVLFKTTLAPAVIATVVDRFGNPTSAGGAIAVSAAIDSGPKGAQLSGNSPQVAAQGVATFSSLSLGKGGKHRIRLEAPGLAAATFEVFASGLVVDHPFVTLEAGGGQESIATSLAVPPGASTDVTFLSYDSNIVTVDQASAGDSVVVLTGLYPGTAVLHIESVADPRLYVDIQVTVNYSSASRPSSTSPTLKGKTPSPATGKPRRHPRTVSLLPRSEAPTEASTLLSCDREECVPRAFGTSVRPVLLVSKE